MRYFIDSNYHKTYYDIPNAVDFYSGKKGIVEVDPDISEIIKTLNSKGYRTKTSCSGHYIKGTTSYGYIAMETFKNYKLPKGFYRSEDDDSHCIRWKTRTEAGLNGKWVKLKQWADSLPTRIK